MKPRNKYQKRVVALSDALPKISEKQKQYAYKNAFLHYYAVSRNRLFCLECGHKWKESSPEWHNEVAGNVKCPSCEKKLKKIRRNEMYMDAIGYMSIVTVVDGFQVERMFLASKVMKKGSQPRFNGMEVMQKWMDETGKTTTIARTGSGAYAYYRDTWVWGSEFSLKDAYYLDQRYDTYPDCVYPGPKVLPIFKRNGFKSSFHGFSAHKFLYKLLLAPRAETLLKTKQISLLREYIKGEGAKVERYWRTINICNRNGYIVGDASIWLDYLDLLAWFGKDLRNAKFVCPKNLHKEHDVLVEKKSRIQERVRQQRQEERLQMERVEFMEKSMFFGLSFTDGHITVKTLDSIEEYKEEGDKLHHCVYANSYHTRKNSICLSARVDGEPIETIEVSLESFDIIQCRGLRNANSPLHQQIVDLVNNNIHLLRQRAQANKKKNAGKKQLKKAC